MSSFRAFRLLLILIIIPNIFCAKQAPHPSYLKLGAYGLSYHMNATGICWAGGWLPQSMPGECVCVKGIWAVSTGYCDTDTTIYTGDGHCFRIDKKKRVRKLFNLDNNKMKPFTSSSYLVSAMGHEFVTIKDSYHNSPHQDFLYMIRVNPKKPIFMKKYDGKMDKFSEKDSFCAPSVRKEYQALNTSKYIMITDISGRNHFNLGKPGWCPPYMMREYWILTVGQSFRLSDQQITEGRIGNPSSCSAPKIIKAKPSRKAEEYFYFREKKGSGSGRTGGDDDLGGNATSAVAMGAAVDPSPVDYEIPDIEVPVDPAHPQFRGFGGRSDYDNLEYDIRWPVEADHEEQVKQLQVQTARLGSYYMEWVFNQKTGPKINHVKEWEYAKLARKLLLKTCMSPVMTPTAVNNLFRWFRWIFRESLEVFPYVSFTDDDLHGRIMDALTKCLDGSKEMTFNYNSTCDYNKVVSVTHDGQTYRDPLPDQARFDISRLEPSIELAWKIMMNAHYYCANYFVDYPSDHSALNVKYEAMLSPLVRKRWENPGKTFELMKVMWSTVELTPVFEALDFCVSASYTMSTYKKLLVRPINEEPTLFPGVYPGDPPIPPPPTGKKKKRSVRIPVHRNLWGHWGYCLEYTSDAATLYGAKGKCTRDEN